mgnify:CR=1 FL=1|tara:strand:+ start:2149 stop:2514 length:366 start_codon:yes stop_codon:yes gene_type:complete
MKYLIANEQGVLTNLGGDDETVMFGQNAVLSIESLTDTTSNIFVQSSKDVDSVVTLTITHADKSAALTHKTERVLIDEIVSAINSDSREGYTVLFDALNDVKLPSQILVQGSDVEAGVTEA